MSSSDNIRQKIWKELVSVALPDSRFHLNFAEYIPDFDNSDSAIQRVISLDEYKQCEYAFITPDNCLVGLRQQMIEDGIPFVMSTYGIYRGFLLIEPGMVPDGDAKYAAWLDGMEHFGRPIKLDEIAQGRKFDFLVTGASAVSKNGVRFGKGHGFFDLEWGMFTDVGVVDEKTAIAAVIHECQLVEEDLTPSETDILVDYIVTPMELHRVLNRVQRPSGIKWSLLNNDQIQDTPPIQELQKMQGLK